MSGPLCCLQNCEAVGEMSRFAVQSGKNIQTGDNAPSCLGVAQKPARGRLQSVLSTKTGVRA